MSNNGDNSNLKPINIFYNLITNYETENEKDIKIKEKLGQ